MSELTIRDATPGDAEAIAAIYDQGIEDRVATLETEPRTADERAQWLAAKGPRHPVLVAVDGDGSVVGWGRSTSSTHARPTTTLSSSRSTWAESSAAAVSEACSGSARSSGAIARIPQDGAGRLPVERGRDVASTRSTASRRSALYREQGRLDDRWVDVILMEKILN